MSLKRGGLQMASPQSFSVIPPASIVRKNHFLLPSPVGRERVFSSSCFPHLRRRPPRVGALQGAPLTVATGHIGAIPRSHDGIYTVPGQVTVSSFSSFLNLAVYPGDVTGEQGNRIPPRKRSLERKGNRKHSIIKK
jgi:hypothetical protein